MKEGLLLRRITGECRHIVRWHSQLTTLVESNLTDAALSLVNQAAMTAGKALERTVFEVLGQLYRSFNREVIENGCEWC